MADSRERISQNEREQTLTALHRAAREIGRADKPKTVYETLIETAENVLEFDLVAVDVERNGYLIQEAWTLDQDNREYWDKISLEADDTFAVRAYNRQQTILVPDLRETEITPADPEYRSALTVPIGEFGTFQAVFSQPNGFSDRDKEFTELLVDHARVKLSRLEDKEELRTRTAELERQNERLDQFASIVSHDLRNPMNVAKLRLDLVERECNSEHLSDVDTALTRMEELIEHILTLARQGQAVGETTAVELAEIVEHCWSNVETGQASIECPSEQRFWADESRLASVFENLFRNAVEHGSTSPPSQAQEDAVEHGGNDVTVRVGILPEENGFYVADTGSGISEDQRDQVFERGYSTDTDGTGYGLVIVRDVVEAHGWDIEVTESDAGGARFEMTGVNFVE